MTMRTIKRILLVVMLAVAAVALCACGAQVQTGNRITYGKDVQTFTYGYIWLGDRMIAEGYINQWRDYDNSDTVQLMIDGKYYLTHYSCVVMVADPSQGALTYGSPSYQDYGHSN